MLLAALRFVGQGRQAAFDQYQRALLQICVARLGELIPGDNVDIVGRLGLFTLAVNRDREVRHRITAGKVADLRIAYEVSDESVAIVSWHFLSPFTSESLEE